MAEQSHQDTNQALWLAQWTLVVYKKTTIQCIKNRQPTKTTVLLAAKGVSLLSQNGAKTFKTEKKC